MKLKMRFASLCRVCLSNNKRTKIIANTELQTVFENLTSNQLTSGDGRPERVCYLCHRLLQRCYKFINLSRRSEECLSQLLRSGVDLNQHSLTINCPSIQNDSLHLSVCETTLVSIANLEEGAYAEVHIKQDPSIEVHIKDDTKSENTVKVEFEENKCAVKDTNDSAIFHDKSMKTQFDEKSPSDDQDSDSSNVPSPVHRQDTPSPGNVGNSSMKTVRIEQELNSEYTSVISPKQIIEYQKSCKDSNVKKNASLTKGKTNTVQKKNSTNGKKIKRKKTKQINSVKSFACEINNCAKTFKTKRSLKIHTRSHTGEKPYTCHVCARSFVRKYYLQRHLLIHTGEKPHACHFCPKKFIQRPHLQDHIRTHTGEKPFTCSICSSKFKTADTLKKHFKRHGEEKPFLCIMCPKKFFTNAELKLHSRFHTGETPFACDKCPSVFKFLQGFKEHKRTHTGEKPFACHKCPKQFGTSMRLKRHVERHNSEDQCYACYKCSRTYKYKQSLEKHIATHTDDR